MDFASVASWIGVAGTATTLAGVYLELERYDRERVHGSRIPVPAMAGAACTNWLALTVEEIRATAVDASRAS